MRTVLAREHRRRPAPLLDCAGYLRDLHIAVSAGVAGIGNEPIDRPRSTLSAGQSGMTTPYIQFAHGKN